MHNVRNDYRVIFLLYQCFREEHWKFSVYIYTRCVKKVEKENQIFELVSFVNYLQVKLFDIDFLCPSR